MTLEWLARIGLALWFVYGLAAWGEGLRHCGSVGLRWIEFLTEASVVTALVWAAWWL